MRRRNVAKENHMEDKKRPQRFSHAMSPGELAWRRRTQNPVTGSAFKDDLTAIQSDDHYRRALEDLERLIDNDFLKRLGITGS
jgi:hypothetical protein